MEVKYYYIQESFIGQNYIECTKDEYIRLMAQGVPVMTHYEEREKNGDIRSSFEYSIEIPMQIADLSITKQ